MQRPWQRCAGKHYAEFKKGNNPLLLTPKLSKIFPVNEAVNAALSSLVSVARSAVGANVALNWTRHKAARPSS